MDVTLLKGLSFGYQLIGITDYCVRIPHVRVGCNEFIAISDACKVCRVLCGCGRGCGCGCG